MNPFDRLPEAAAEIFGEEATAEEAYGLLTVDVPADSWIEALRTARSTLGCTYFDWLSAVDEPGTGFRVCAHVVALGEGAGTIRRLLVRTTVPHEAAVLPTATGVYAGAAWHERETHEMFGVDFTGHPHLAPLLLPEEFEGHPLRKDFVLAARVAKAWPGAKEPGESEHGGHKRRQMLPPGVPDPNEWGPLKGQLPPAPARPARAPRTAAGDRPPRRTRSVSEGSASQQPDAGAVPSGAAAPAPPEAPAPRKRTPDAPWQQPRDDRQPARKPEETPAGKPEETPAETPGRGSGVSPAGRPGETPAGKSDEGPGASPAARPGATPAETPGQGPGASPAARPAGKPAGTRAEGSAGTPNATPDGTPNATPDGKLNATPDGMPAGKPDGEGGDTA